jgi:NADH-quinone oxidoreductase subunit M
MILIYIIIILFAGGLLAWLFSKINDALSRWISLIFLIADFVLAIILWLNSSDLFGISNGQKWITEISYKWIPQFGISFHFAADGLSLLLILLTLFLGIISVLTSWKGITKNVGFYHFNLLWILAGITGVFTSLDLFLFYSFWEVMLIPMYFLIGIWGHENRIYASFKFFIFTQASGLLMFIAILALYFIHGHNTGNYTFDYTALLGTHLSSSVGMWIMLGFLIAFVVKLPVVPFHNWLPDAHTEAPTAGSVILAGLLLKTGAYGILRFVIPLFPEASKSFAPVAFILGVTGILYGAKLAFAQTDFKRLVAYTSVSHMGFILLGAFAFNQLAMQGVILQMLTHGISTGALFILVGSIQDRIHTRDINSFGGLWEQVPRMGGIGLVFAMASLGLPALGNFVAEFLILAGSFQSTVFWTIIASLGLVASTLYSLRIMQKVFYGEKKHDWQISDFDGREILIMACLILSIVWIGIYPRSFLRTTQSSVQEILRQNENPEIIEVNNNSNRNQGNNIAETKKHTVLK